MTKIGKLYICDRCGKTAFAEYTSGCDRSGWIDPYSDNFEKLEGWEIRVMKNLCPDCAKEYHIRLRGFWKEKTK